NGVTVAGRLVARADLCKELQIGRMWFRPPGLNGLYFETAPSVTSRITLADTVDPVFGQRQSKATWQFNATDQRTYNLSVDTFGEPIKPLGGQLYYKKPWEDVVNDAVVNGHHIGTTRMSS